jgi:HAD superfamily hydrolase (TIGR01509 family)
VRVPGDAEALRLLGVSFFYSFHLFPPPLPPLSLTLFSLFFRSLFSHPKPNPPNYNSHQSKSVSPEEFIPFVGTGEANFLSGVAKQRGISEPDIPKLKDLFFSEYLTALKSSTGGEQIAAPGARALVAACRAAGLRTAVASAADLVKVDASLDAVGFVPRGDFFDAVVTADAFERLKPAPDAFLAAAAAVGTDPRNCVVIEDAPAGVAAARAAGMRVLGVCTTLTRQQMEAEGPDAVRRDTSEVTVEELLGLVDRTVVGGGVVA